MKKGDKGKGVADLQIFLNQNGFNLVVDGDFGAKTEEAVKAYQLANNMPVTGEIGAISNNDGRIVKRFLSPSQYCTSQSKKIGVCLHHTAGNGDADNVRKVWENDNRGRVATHFVVGADGLVIQCMPLENWGYHIATSRMGFSTSHAEQTNQKYIGIEICNWGYLTKKGDKFYNYVDGLIPDSEVVDLGEGNEFRTFRYWHKYTDAQVYSVQWLLAYLKKQFGFKYEDLPLDAQWLELSWDALAHRRVLTTHTNFEYGKFDCSPQENFFKMIAK